MTRSLSIPGENDLARSLPDRGRWRRIAVGSLLLATVVAVIYWPSLHHLPHSDQSNFVLDTIECNDFAELVAHTYSFARTRVLFGGDTQLFRPVLFLALAAEQEFFGLRWEWCQALSILLHIVASILLLVLLEIVFRRARPADIDAGKTPFTYLPFAIAFFFALNYAIVEQVIWYHIQGYLLALVLILVAMILLVRAADAMGKAASNGLIAGAWALTLVAAFTYELGQFFAVCASLFLIGMYWPGWRQRILGSIAFLAIVPIYQGINQVDLRLHADTCRDDGELSALVEQAVGLPTLKNVTRYVLYTTVQPFLPGRIVAHSHGKLCLEELIWPGTPAPPFEVVAHSYEGCRCETHVWNHSLKVRPSLIPGAVVLALGAGLMLLGLCRLPAPALPVLGLLVGPGLAQACLIVLGRLNMRPGPVTLAYNSHYTYVGLLFSLGVAALGLAYAQGVQDRCWRRRVHTAAALLVLGLLALGAGSAFKVYEINARMAEEFRPSWRWLRSLRDFVEAHQHEPDFRFAVAWNSREPMPQYWQFPVPYLFCRRYLDCEHPKYVLWYEDRKFVGMPVAEWSEKHPEGGPHFCSDFVRLGQRYQVFSHGGLYYAVRKGAIGAFLASPHPEHEPGFQRDSDLQTLIRWTEAYTP